MKKNIATKWGMILTIALGGLILPTHVLAVDHEDMTSSTQQSTIHTTIAEVPTTSRQSTTSRLTSEGTSSLPMTSTDTSTNHQTSTTISQTTVTTPTTTKSTTPAPPQDPKPEAKPIYRLYHPITGEHLYTTDRNEKDVLYQQRGWGYEGIAWYAPGEGKPVYRLYNAGLMNHLYTSDTNEVKVLTSRHGWKSDNNGRPVFYSGGTVKIYRVYNYRLRGLHHWTTDEYEYSVLPRHGWTQEGNVFHGERKGQPIRTQFAADEAIAAQVKGLGGYHLSGNAKQDVVKAIKQIKAQGYQMGFVMMDVHTKRGVEYNADQRFYAASTVKGPYVASLAAKNPVSIAQSGTIMRQVLSYSSNEGYEYLANRYGFGTWRQWLAEAGVRSDIGKDLYPYYSSRELFKLWQRNYTYFTNDRQGQQVGLWYENPNLSPIKSALGGQYRTRSKAGWIGDWEFQSASDGGIVYAKSGPYIIAIMTDASGQLDKLQPTVRALNTLVTSLDETHKEMVKID